MAKRDRLQQIAISAIRDPSDDGAKEIIQGAETEPDLITPTSPAPCSDLAPGLVIMRYLFLSFGGYPPSMHHGLTQCSCKFCQHQLQQDV